MPPSAARPWLDAQLLTTGVPGRHFTGGSLRSTPATPPERLAAGLPDYRTAHRPHSWPVLACSRRRFSTGRGVRNGGLLNCQGSTGRSGGGKMFITATRYYRLPCVRFLSDVLGCSLRSPNARLECSFACAAVGCLHGGETNRRGTQGSNSESSRGVAQKSRQFFSDFSVQMAVGRHRFDQILFRGRQNSQNLADGFTLTLHSSG